MKFFTIEWWSGDVENQMSVFDEYSEHIERIRSQLQADHMVLLNDVSLHDSHLTNLAVSCADDSLVIELDGYGFDVSTNSHFGRYFSLIYDGVVSFVSTADADKGLPGPHGYGDLGYDEIDILDSGVFEHRMLFSSGIVLKVKHRKFALRYTDVE